MTVPTHKSELLMPAGLIDKLKMAILYCSRKKQIRSWRRFRVCAAHQPWNHFVAFVWVQTRNNRQNNSRCTPRPHLGLPLLFALFDQENITELTQRIILMNVLRKKQSLTQEQWDCLKLGRETLLHVLGEDLDKKYSAKYDALQNSQEIKTAARRLKTPRIGMEVCCCKGCNGCLIFWHDPTYEKARTLLAQKSRVSCLTTIYWNLMRRCWHCRLKPEISLPA